MPTSPATRPPSASEIEVVFGDGQPAPSRFKPASSLVQEWRRLGRFLARPTLLPANWESAPLTVIGRIYLLDVALMLALIAMAGVAVAMGVELPETALAGIEFTPAIVLLVIVGAPVMEELAFRGWLAGRPGQLIAAGIIALGAFIAFGTDWTQSNAQVNWKAIVLALAVLTGTLTALIALRGRSAPGWYQRVFPLFFWGSTLGFALIHIANFEDASVIAALPLVLPQFVIGALLGYVRVTIGLWAAILLHAAHNASALALASLAMGGEAVG